MRVIVLGLAIVAASGCKGKDKSGAAGESSDPEVAALPDGMANCGKPFESSFPLPAIGERRGYFNSREYNQALGLKFPDSYDVELDPPSDPEAIMKPQSVLQISDRSISDRKIPVGKLQPIAINGSSGPSVDMFNAGLPKNVAVVGGNVVVCKLPKKKGDNIVVYVDVQIGNYVDNTPFGTVKGTIDVPAQYRDASDVSKE